jgi:hypothetical protein
MILSNPATILLDKHHRTVLSPPASLCTRLALVLCLQVVRQPLVFRLVIPAGHLRDVRFWGLVCTLFASALLACRNLFRTDVFSSPQPCRNLWRDGHSLDAGQEARCTFPNPSFRKLSGSELA